MRNFILYLGLIFCWSCHSDTGSDVQVFKIDPNHFSDKTWDDFYSLKEVIPLETNDSSVMTEIMKVIAVKDRLFILTWRGDCIYVFGRDGKFISKLGKQGRGPGEYQLISDFVITENLGQVIIYDWLGKLITYDWNGKFLQEKKWESFMCGAELLPDGNWLTCRGRWMATTPGDTAFLLRITDSEGKCLKGDFVMPKGSLPLPKMPAFLYKDRNRFFAAPITENTIYECDYEKKSFNPVYSFVIKNHLRPEVYKENDEKPFFYEYYIFSGLYVGNKTLLMNASCVAENKTMSLVADKKSGQAYVLPDELEDKENELNLNRFLQHSGLEGDVLAIARPIQIVNRKYKKEHSVGSQLSNQLSEEDNPVLVVYEEK